MTVTGKCDICRRRKIKCDEQKPACSSCLKANRSCAYSYGKAHAFVHVRPNKPAKIGKGRINKGNLPSRHASEWMRVVAQVASSSKRDGCDGTHWALHDLALYNQAQGPAALIQPKNFESSLLAKWNHAVSAHGSDVNPLLLWGSWIYSVGPRIGHSAAVDGALVYMLSALDNFLDESFTKRKLARANAGKALKELRLALQHSDETSDKADILFAMSLLLNSEVFMGVGTYYYQIHSVGIAQLLAHKPLGSGRGIEYYSFAYGSYCEELIEALQARRPSLYDNPIFLEATAPERLLRLPSTAYEFASRSVMHLMIQAPRIKLLTHNCLTNRHDTASLSSAFELARALFKIVQTHSIGNLLESFRSTVEVPPSPEIQDIIPHSFHFDSIPIMRVLLNWWTFLSFISGLIESLYMAFPTETKAASLPPLDFIHALDITAGKHLAMSAPYVFSATPSLPIAQLRFTPCFEISFGSWYRLEQRLSRACRVSDAVPGEYEYTRLCDELSKARRMKVWVTTAGDWIYDIWKCQKPDVKTLENSVGMYVEKVPSWGGQADLEAMSEDLHDLRL